MTLRTQVLGWLSLALASVAVCPAFAAGIDCSHAHAVVEKTLCASSRLLALDSQLSAAYIAALTRNPAQAEMLKHDELEWLGERNVAVWRSSALVAAYPTLPGNQDARLADFYDERIAFLRNVNNPGATKNLPIAQKLLTAAQSLPSGTTDVLEALQAAGVVTVPPSRAIDGGAPLSRAISALAAPPDAKLDAAFLLFKDDTITLVYLPSAGLGGGYTTGGTALCQSWVMFEKRGKVTVPVVETEELNGSGLCMRDDGSTGYLAMIAGYPVAITQTNDPTSLNTDLQWRRWLGGSHWGPAIRVRLRFHHELQADADIDCPEAAPQCAATAAIALNAARSYEENPSTLLAPAWLTPTERASFDRMRALAPTADWKNCVEPLWFPARVEGKLVVAGISESHVACHPGDAWLQVGFWGAPGHDKAWWYANVNILSGKGHLQLAARILPRPKP